MVGIYDVPGTESKVKMNKDILYPLRRLHGRLHQFKIKCNLRKEYRDYFKKNPRSVFLLLTPEHGNLGDHAIAQAETNILKELGINYIEITGRKLGEMKWADHLSVMNGFPILINGGGNLGTLWMDVENLQREIMQKNPKSNILVLPNTVFYEENEWGQEELHKSIQIYNGHKHLTIYAREQASYAFMKPIYRDVRLVPDMVLSLKKDAGETARKGCLLCLRGDCEKTRTQQQDDMIRDQAKALFGDAVSYTDMIAKGTILPCDREAALEKKYQEFRNAELVITDRLHAMIFCAITGTSCIVINSKSPKVRGCYEWIKHLDYIRFADSPEDIAAQYQMILVGPHAYDNTHLTHYYEQLAEDIEDIWR